MKILRKTFELVEFKANETGNGSFEGYGSVFGNVDDGLDVVDPGAFVKALPDFLRDGFYSWGHDWNMPVAMPTAAREDSHGLFLAGEFHSTTAGQDARTISRERADKGLRMGLSIGYGVEDYYMAGQVRHLKTINPLFEVGLVMVPMNREANQTSVKGAADPAGSLPDSVGRIIDDLPGIVDRMRSMSDLRTKEGRTLSAANRSLIAELLAAIEAVSAPLNDLLAATDPQKSAREVAALVEEARLLGVAV